jgi:hypothetical protein
MPIPLRADFDAQMVWVAAKRSKDGAQARRLLALAATYEDATRTEAAKIGGVTLQIVCDCVLKFNAHGRRSDRSKAAGKSASAERYAPSRVGRIHRERSDPCHSRRECDGGSSAATLPSRWPRSPSHGKCSRRVYASSQNYGHSLHQRQRETFDNHVFKGKRQEECVQMPEKTA